MLVLVDGAERRGGACHANRDGRNRVGQFPEDQLAREDRTNSLQELRRFDRL